MNTALKDTLDSYGFAVIGAEDMLFSASDWDLLENGVNHESMPYERVVTGDAGEPNLVEVGRLMTDIDRPQVVNAQVSEPMLSVLGSDPVMRLVGELIGCDDLSIRRAQINKMHSGSFIGLHVDQDSNPDYSIAIVLQFGSEFTGGEFLVHGRDGAVNSVSPGYRSVIISRCDWAHQVLPVTSGVRTSLVFFISGYDGPNRRIDRLESVLA